MRHVCCCCETHNAHALRDPSTVTGAAIAMDGGVADTACYYTDHMGDARSEQREKKDFAADARLPCLPLASLAFVC